MESSSAQRAHVALERHAPKVLTPVITDSPTEFSIDWTDAGLSQEDVGLGVPVFSFETFQDTSSTRESARLRGKFRNGHFTCVSKTTPKCSG